MLTDIKIDVASLTPDLICAKSILKDTDNASAIIVCNMYIRLCARIADGIAPTVTGAIVERIGNSPQSLKGLPMSSIN